MKKNLVLVDKNLESTIPNNFIIYSDKIYLMYNAQSFINPPFFDNIYLLRAELSDEELKMIMNMTKMGGSIYFIKKYLHFFKNNYINLGKEDKLFKFVKKNNKVYNDFNKHKPLFDFIIMGAQKAGTTALSLNIGLNPGIAINMDKDPTKSEIHFFDIKWNYGIDWFKKRLPTGVKHNQLIGFKNPDLMNLENTFPLIQLMNPYVKIILILRNPIYRAYSAWKFQKKYMEEKRSFEEAINNEINDKLKNNPTFFTIQKKYLERGLYYKYIKKILEWFSPDNLLILIQEEVLENMVKEYNKVYQFLNLKTSKNWNAKYTMEFVSDDKSEIDSKFYKKLMPYFIKDVRSLEQFLGRKTGWF
jgi:hypothetical protein